MTLSYLLLSPVLLSHLEVGVRGETYRADFSRMTEETYHPFERLFRFPTFGKYQGPARTRYQHEIDLTRLPFEVIDALLGVHEGNNIIPKHEPQYGYYKRVRSEPPKVEIRQVPLAI